MYSIIYDKKFIAEAHDADLRREVYAEASANRNTEIATNLIHMTSMTNEQISEITGLDIDKVKELRQNASC